MIEIRNSGCRAAVAATWVLSSGWQCVACGALPRRCRRRLPTIVLVTAVLVGNVSGAFGQAVELKPRPSFRDGDPRTWTAFVTVTGERVVTLRVALPASTELVASLVPFDDHDARVFRRGRGHWEIHAKNQGEARFKMTLEGPADKFRNDLHVKYTWYEQGRHAVRRLFNGPVEKEARQSSETGSSSPVRLAFGTGLSWRIDDAIDFSVDDAGTRLWIENDSRLRLSGPLGALFTMKRLNDDTTFDLLTSLEFVNQTTRLLAGDRARGRGLFGWWRGRDAPDAHDDDGADRATVHRHFDPGA